MYMIWFLFVLVAVTSADIQEQKKSYNGHSVWKVTPNDDEGLQYLKDLYFNGTGYLKMNFWHPPTKIGQQVDIMVNPDSLTVFKFECKSRNITVSQFISNVQSLIDAEKKPQNISLRYKPMRDSRSFDFSRYPTLEQIEAFVKGLPVSYTGFVEWQYIATTHENRKVLMAKITNRYTDRPNVKKPGIWIDAGIHAREWIAPTTSLYAINQLLSNYNNTDPRYSTKKYVDNLVWYVVPVMNPDGYAYTFSVDRMWRKNRRPKSCGSNVPWTQCCEGVDLNRNFGFHWAESGSSPNSCTEVFHGPSSFSEPESRGVRDYVTKVQDSLKAYLTLHSYSLMWIYPFGYKPYTYTSDKSELVRVAQKATKALQTAYGTTYTIGSAPDILYSAAGGSDDWAKGVANIKYVYTIELRPGDNGYNNGFILPPSQIAPTGEETWIAFKTIADEILNYPSIGDLPADQTDTTTAESIDVDTRVSTQKTSSQCTDSNTWCKFWAYLNRCTVSDVSSQCKLSCKLC